MTTFWARMLVFRAWEKGEISEKCARYFDELLDKYRFNIDLDEIKIFNTNKYCVLRKFGVNDDGDFNIISYINRSTYYENTNKGIKPIYLANIIETDYKYLGTYIQDNLDEFNKKEVSKILEYLNHTSYKCVHPDNVNIMKSKLERKIDIFNCLSGKESDEEVKINQQYQKPAYTDLLDADY